MRKISKYKIFNIVGIKTKVYPTRILKFRRPKWIRLQKLYLNKFKSKLINILQIKNVFKSWEKIKKYYKKGLEAKNLLNCAYESTVKTKFIYKNIDKTLIRKNLITNLLIKPQFRLNVLLWKLKIFSSSYESKQVINNNLVLINGTSVKSNYYVKKGDIISFKLDVEKKFFFLNSVKKYSLNESFLTFIELDYYTKTIIVLKNCHELDYQDFPFVIDEYLNTKRLSYR